jgi:hypothetical protein
VVKDTADLGSKMDVNCELHAPIHLPLAHNGQVAGGPRDYLDVVPLLGTESRPPSFTDGAIPAHTRKRALFYGVSLLCKVESPHLS